MAAVDELVLVMRDASLEGDAAALTRLGAALAQHLDADGAGADEHGLWLRLSIPAAAGERVAHTMRWIWPGRYLRGSPPSEAGRMYDEGPQQPVVISRGLWMGETPVTQALYLAVIGHNPSDRQDPDRPVEQVRQAEAVAFCERLQQRFPALCLRLPSEAEWEYAARASTTTATYNGDFEEGTRLSYSNEAPQLDEIAWYYNHYQVPEAERCTRPVALKRANAWGLYDMLGNVWEWTLDRADLDGYPDTEQSDPVGKEGRHQVFRGGSWRTGARSVRAACRGAYDYCDNQNDVGFRVVGLHPPFGLSEAQSEAQRADPLSGPTDPGGEVGIARWSISRPAPP